MEFGLSSGCFQWLCYDVVAVVAVAVGQLPASPHHHPPKLGEPEQGGDGGTNLAHLLAVIEQTLVASPRPKQHGGRQHEKSMPLPVRAH